MDHNNKTRNQGSTGGIEVIYNIDKQSKVKRYFLKFIFRKIRFINSMVRY